MSTFLPSTERRPPKTTEPHFMATLRGSLALALTVVITACGSGSGSGAGTSGNSQPLTMNSGVSQSDFCVSFLSSSNFDREPLALERSESGECPDPLSFVRIASADDCSGMIRRAIALYGNPEERRSLDVETSMSEIMSWPGIETIVQFDAGPEIRGCRGTYLDGGPTEGVPGILTAT